MDLNSIDHLTEISREKSIFYENFYDWNSYVFSKDLIWKNWFMDEGLLSIYGTTEYESLSEFQKKHLSYLEVCQIIYTYASTEAIMCLFLARILPNYPIWSSEYKFILREQIEEYRHQDMFERSLHILQSEHAEISHFWKFTMKMESLLVSPKYFFILQVVIELISWDFWDECIKNKDVCKLIRDNSIIHAIEESRHIEFAEIMLDNYFKNAWFFSKTLGGWFVFFDILFINAHYLKIENFKKLWVVNYRSLYFLAKNNWKRNKLKNFSSERWLRFIERYGFVTWANRWAFNIFLWFKI
jgi:hypothetical protein